jgi:hypothetical protein
VSTDGIPGAVEVTRIITRHVEWDPLALLRHTRSGFAVALLAVLAAVCILFWRVKRLPEQVAPVALVAVSVAAYVVAAKLGGHEISGPLLQQSLLQGCTAVVTLWIARATIRRN